ncbi:AraC family transcriptional regulator (plasmid) [Bacillus sp. CMF21]|nr:AraC family transcriptional regulator [Bacillus sp. CMF21]
MIMDQYPKRLTNNMYMTSTSIQVFYGTHKGKIDLHWHEFYEMSVILKGEGIHVLNGTSYPIVPGSLFLLTPADFHELVPTANGTFEILNVIFTDEQLIEEIRQLLFQQTKTLMTVFEGEELASIEADYRRLWDESNNRREGHRIVIERTLQRMLVDVARKCNTRLSHTEFKQEESLNQAIRQALIYMHHHFREPLTLKDAARQAQLSTTYFSECFHKIIGVSFQHYLQDLRIQFARTLLHVSNLPITEICLASGFNTLSHFERVFKREFQQSPRVYRQNKPGNIK